VDYVLSFASRARSLYSKQANKVMSGKDVPGHGMARQDQSSSLFMARAFSERSYGELCRSKVDVNSGVRCDRSLETNKQTKTTNW